MNKLTLAALSKLMMTLVTLLAASLAPSQAAAASHQLDQAQSFIAAASFNGEAVQFDLDEALSRGSVVLYFFPAAYTRGCDLQAREFAQNVDRFAALGARIVGVSADGLDKLNEFSADPEYCAGKFPIVSDPEGRVAELFGLSLRSVPADAVDGRGQPLAAAVLPRTSFVIDQDGRILARLSSEEDGLSPQAHIHQALRELEEVLLVPDQPSGLEPGS